MKLDASVLILNQIKRKSQFIESQDRQGLLNYLHLHKKDIGNLSLILKTPGLTVLSYLILSSNLGKISPFYLFLCLFANHTKYRSSGQYI